MDVVLLSRLQFALTVMVHYIFPPLTIGLGVIMAVSEAWFLRTGDRRYEQLAQFWSKLFAVTFAVGVATGIVMEFEFGTNWATYSRFVGDVFGSALAAEGIFAFFLESGFLAVVVFGWGRVSPRVHFFATVMLCLGTVFSAVWIVVANSWQQTPAGYHIVGQGLSARAEIVDFWAMVFNPSSLHRLIHVLLGALLQGAFFVMSLSAWYVLKRRHVDLARRGFDIALVVGAVASLAIVVSGHQQAQNVAHTQPAKLAAFEGHFRSSPGGAPLYLFGVPDSASEQVDYGLAVPGALSLLTYGDPNQPVTALDQFTPQDRPPIGLTFQSYHLMVALGMLFVGLTWLGLLLRWRGKLYTQRWLMALFVAAVVGPIAANQAGWVAAEVGRQPWVVYGLLRTSDAVSRAVPAEQVLGSIVLFSLVYAGLLALWLFVLNSKIQHGPPSALRPDAAAAGPAELQAALRRGEEHSLTGVSASAPAADQEG
jgi:cytochrome d ubiquinol oxidase subunit I